MHMKESKFIESIQAWTKPHFKFSFLFISHCHAGKPCCISL